MTRWNFWQSRLTSGEQHWHSSMYTSPLRPPAHGTTPLTLTLFWRTVETRWCLATLTPTISPGSPEPQMTGQRPEGRLSTGRSTVCKPRYPYPTPLSGPALFARCHPSQQSSPPQRDMVNPHHPSVWPSPHNHFPLQSRPALTAESSVFHEFLQGWLGRLHSRTREEIRRYPNTYPLYCRGKTLQADPRRCRKTSHPLWLCQGLQRPSPRSLCDPSSRREISAALNTLSTLSSSWWTGTSSGLSARMHKTSGGPSWNPPIPNATAPYSWEARVRTPT